MTTSWVVINPNGQAQGTVQEDGTTGATGQFTASDSRSGASYTWSVLNGGTGTYIGTNGAGVTVGANGANSVVTGANNTFSAVDTNLITATTNNITGTTNNVTGTTNINTTGKIGRAHV